MDRRTYLTTTAATLGALSTAGCVGSSQQGGLLVKDRYLRIQDVGRGDSDDRPAEQADTSQAAAEDVMQDKINQAVNTLEKDGLGTETYEAAISEGMEGLFLSNLAVLPTEGVSASEDLFNTWLSHEDFFEGALDMHINETGTSESKATGMDARNFLQVTTEAMKVVGEETKNTDPNNPEGSDLISQPDEPQSADSAADTSGTTGDTEAVPLVDLSEGFHRQVRSPFFMGWNLGVTTRKPQETVIETEAMWPGQCQSILKETRGVKVIVRPVLVPIWVEPWFARARIVGQKLIWVWEFVPAEFIKTINVCNRDGEMVQEIESKVVPEEKMMHFWRFF